MERDKPDRLAGSPCSPPALRHTRGRLHNCFNICESLSTLRALSNTKNSRTELCMCYIYVYGYILFMSNDASSLFMVVSVL